ncbi:uncharacterized protein AAGF69_001645 isoform 6-T10 [Amazona ochrocephala]
MVSRSGLQCAALMSYRYKLQCLKIQVRQVARERDKARLDLEKAERRCLQLARERDKARLDLEKAERRCLQLGRELDKQYIALEHTQSKLRDFQAETEAKDLLLQQAVSHQAKLEADAQLFQGKEASWQGRLNHTMKENIQLQNKVMEMAEKLAASEKLVLELQKELNCVVKDKGRAVPAAGGEQRAEKSAWETSARAEAGKGEGQRTQWSEESNGEISHLNVRMCQQGYEVAEHQAGHGAGSDTIPLWSQRLAEAEWLQGAQMAARLEHHQQHAACWMEMELLQQQLKASQEKLLEAKASLSLAQTRHALQLQQVKAQMNNMVPRKHFEELQTSLRAEQCKAQQLQENLHQQAEQTCKQLLRTQEEHERLLQAAMEQAEALEHSLRSTEAVLAERAAQLEDAQAQLSRNKLLIEDLREENRGVAMALQTAELKQKSTEEKNQLLEGQASALKQLIGKITPASLSG